jgi:hypothetical protein
MFQQYGALPHFSNIVWDILKWQTPTEVDWDRRTDPLASL